MAGEISLGDEDGGPISNINVTPFVDVVLVLLVIFIVTAPTLLKDAIQVKLPKASSSDPQLAQSLGIVVTREGQILLNGQLATPEALTQAVKQALQSQPDLQAIIGADEEAHHRDVVHAIDLIKSAGLTRFALQIEHP